MHRKTAGELANKALKDTTDYNAMELGYAVVEDVSECLRKSIEIYRHMIDEPEFCVVYLIADDPLISPLKRHKYYCWPYLPSPRPNQSVFLYNKEKDEITKRLWVLPNAGRMAQLASTSTFVPKQYETMQAWSVAFFKGVFWEYIRFEHKIDMLSENEYIKLHRQELIDSGCQIIDDTFSQPFDFSQIGVKKVINPSQVIVD